MTKHIKTDSLLLSPAEVAEILAIARRTVYDLAAPLGPIPCYRMGRRCIRFERSDIDAYIEKTRVVPLSQPPFDRNAGAPSIAELKARFAGAGYKNVSITPAKCRNGGSS